MRLLQPSIPTPDTINLEEDKTYDIPWKSCRR